MSECGVSIESAGGKNESGVCRFRRVCSGRVDGLGICLLSEMGGNGSIEAVALQDKTPGFGEFSAKTTVQNASRSRCDTVNKRMAQIPTNVGIIKG